MPRVNRKRKNVPQRKPKTIKFNQNELESEERKAAATTVGDGVEEEATPSADETSTKVVDEDATINQPHAIVMSDGIAATPESDNLTLEEDDIIAENDEITSKLFFSTTSLSFCPILLRCIWL